MGFFEKNLQLFNIAENAKFALQCVSNGIICLKCLFRLNHEISEAKKSEKLKKLEDFSKKKRSHLFKSLLCKNGKAKNLPVVAGRLVNESVSKCSKILKAEFKLVFVQKN